MRDTWRWPQGGLVLMLVAHGACEPHALLLAEVALSLSTLALAPVVGLGHDARSAQGVLLPSNTLALRPEAEIFI